MVKNKNNIQQKKSVSKQEKKFDNIKTEPIVWYKNKLTLLMLASLVVVTFIVLSPVLNAGFVLWDDDYNVFDNANIKALTLHNIKTIFTTACGPNYNPLTTLSFAIEHYFFKLDPFYYHLHNLILHLINTILVFWVMILLRLKKYPAFFVALLFGIHPMHIESVAWITERKDVLYALFYLLAIISYIYHFKHPKKIYYVLIYVFFLLSLLAKIQAVSLPLTLLCIDYILQRPLKIKLILTKIPFFALSLVIGLIGIHFLKSIQAINFLDYTLAERIMVSTASLCVYLFKVLLPLHLMIIHVLPYPNQLGSFFFIAPFIVLLIGILVYLSAKHTRVVVFGMLFFLFNIVFLLQMVPAGNAYNAERFTYISYLGLFYIIAYALNYLIEKKTNLKIPLLSIVGVLIVVFSYNSFTRAQEWKNTETLFTSLIEKYPETPLGYTVRARYYTEKSMYEKAIADLSKHIELRPNDPYYDKRGINYFKIQNYDKAILDFTIAIKQDPKNIENYQNRGVAYSLIELNDSALKDFNKALLLNPKLVKTIVDRALLYNKIKQYDKAVLDCKTLLTMHPDSGIYYNLRAVNKVELKQFDEAAEDYNTALNKGFDAGMVTFNLSVLYYRKGDKIKALEYALKAKDMGKQVDQGYIDFLKR